MSSSGPNSPGTLADDSAVGGVVWSTPSNAAASDDSRATANLTGASGNTHYLKATNFGFSVSGTIDGILVEIERSANVNSGTREAHDSIVKLVVGGSVVGSNKATATAYPTTDAYASYGGAADLWGLTPADTDINGSTFGVVLSTTYGTGVSPKAAVQARVDHIRITITYTATGPAGQPTSKRFGGVPFMGAHGAGIPSAVRQWMRRDSGLFAPRQQVATAIWRPAHGIN